MHKYAPLAIYVVLGLLFMTYLVVRAVILPVTIDESGTYYNFVLKNVWDILIYSGDPSPNNHILNTLCIKLFTGVFGLSSFTLRLPNLLAFVLFYCVMIKWLRLLRNEFWFVMLGLTLILGNPYLLDFFSLARGYGISIALMVASLFYIYRYFTSDKQHFANYALVIAGAAVYASFTLIHFYVCLFVLIIIIKAIRGWNKPLEQFVQHVYPFFVISILLAFICYLPISRMMATDQFVYWGHDGFYKSTLIPLADASRYGQDYAGLLSVQTLAIACIVGYVCMGIYFIVAKFKQHKKLRDLFSFWLFVIFTGIILLINLQFVVVDIPFLNARGALFLFPLFMWIVILIAHELKSTFIQLRQIYVLPVILISCMHLAFSANLTSFREWWFDAYTKDVLAIINADSNNTATSLNTSWIFNNSFRFHIQTANDVEVKLAPFHNELWPDSNYVYYYCERNDVPTLINNYRPIKEFNYGNYILLKRIAHD